MRKAGRRWTRWAVGVLAVAGVAVGAGGPGTGGVPPKVAELLPHAVVLWKSAVLAPEAGPPGWFLLGVGDVNEDGYRDAIFTQTDAAEVLQGDGTGRFTKAWCLFYETRERVDPGGKVVYPVGHFTARSGTLADLDRDGDLDLLASGLFANPTEDPRIFHKLYLFRNEGRFYFERAAAYDPVAPFDRLLVSDVNADGVADILGTSVDLDKEGYHTRVYYLPGQSGFKFGGPTLLFEGRGKPSFLGDINGDGFPDLLLFTEKEVLLYLGSGTEGFVEGLHYAPTEVPVRDVVLGDLNGDGFSDLVVATLKGIVVAHQRKGTFVEASVQSLDFKPHRVHLGDFTGDGFLDAVVEGLRRIMVFSGDGRGGFRDVGSEFALETSGKVHVVDVNSDGLADLLLEGRFFTVVLMNGREPWGVSHLPLAGSQLLGVGDLNGDGGLDLVAERGTGIDVLWNNGKGGFIRLKLADLPFVPVTAQVSAGVLYVLGLSTERTSTGWPPELEERTVGDLVAISSDGKEVGRWKRLENVIPILAVGDFDGDGARDVACSANDALVVLWGGVDLVRYPWPMGELSVIAPDDFDRDGVTEIAAVMTEERTSLVFVSLKGRKLSLSEPLTDFDDVLPLALAVGELDGDGCPDPVAIGLKFTVDLAGEELEVEPTGAQLVLHLSTAGVKTLDLPDFPAQDAPWFLNGLTVGDFSGDGLADVAYTTVGGAGCFVLAGRGDGSFEKAWHIPVPIGPVWTGDLDGTGQDELIATTLGMAPTAWILWNGGGR